MAKNYTPEEQQSAIDKLVRTSVRREYGSLGNRKTNLTFGDVQDAAAGVFILYPNAPYYVVRLARDIELERVQTAESTLEDLIDTVRSTGRRSRPVTKLSSLANAKSALGALSKATEARDTALARLEDVPAYQRFEQSTARFLADEGTSIRSGVDVVQTNKEARSRLAGLVSDLMEQYDDVLERAQYLSVAIQDFDALRLGARLSNTVVSNARGVLSDRFDELDELDPEDRLEILRDVVLDVLAARSTVKGFGSLKETETFVYFSGSGQPYADATHPAVPATLLTDIGEPYTVLDDTTLDLLVDGTTNISVDVPTSYLGVVESFVVEPYEIKNSPAGEENNQLYVSVSDWTTIGPLLTVGATQSAQEVADDINASIGPRPLVSEPYGPQLHIQGEPVEMLATGIIVDFARTSGEDWPDSGQFAVSNGDWFEVTEAVNPENLGWYIVVNVTGMPSTFKTVKETTLSPPVSEFGGTAVGNMNRGGRGVRIRFKDTERQEAVDERKYVGVPVRSAGVINEVVQRAQATLGLSPDSQYQCEGTRAAAVVQFINDNPIIAPSGDAVLEASTEFSGVLWDAQIRSDPLDGTKAVLSKLNNLEGTITNIAYSPGPTGVVTLESLSSDPTVSNLQAGDILVIRGLISATPTVKTDQVGLYGAVNSVSSTQVVATLQFPGTLASLGDQWTMEFGPDLSSEKLPLTLVVDEGEVNQGTYAVAFLGGVDESGPPFELGLERLLVKYTELGTQPYYFNGQVGRQHVRLTSKSTLLDSALSVLASSSAGSLFWNSLPQSDIADTEWFEVPSVPTQVDAGDWLELNDTGAATPTYKLEVFDTEGPNPSLLQFTTTVLSTLGSWDLEQNAQRPWGRVRKRQRENYDVMQEQVADWLRLSASNSERYFAGLRRLLNPLIVNRNPTASAIQDAVDYLYALQQHLTALTAYLDVYESPLAPQVDVLLDTYFQHGSERAIDILLQARFSDFFGLDQDEASYSGDLQKSLRDVNIEDLPQKRYERGLTPELIDSYEEPDFEFDVSDSEDDYEDVSPVGDAYDYPGGSAI
jgi:hypothetical protein